METFAIQQCRRLARFTVPSRFFFKVPVLRFPFDFSTVPVLRFPLDFSTVPVLRFPVVRQFRTGANSSGQLQTRWQGASVGGLWSDVEGDLVLPLERPFLLKQNFDCSQGKEGYGMDPSKLVLYQSDNIAVEKSKFVMWLSPIPFGRIYERGTRIEKDKGRLLD